MFNYCVSAILGDDCKGKMMMSKGVEFREKQSEEVCPTG